jgi:hypothetical protein
MLKGRATRMPLKGAARTAKLTPGHDEVKMLKGQWHDSATGRQIPRTFGP